MACHVLNLAYTFNWTPLSSWDQTPTIECLTLQSYKKQPWEIIGFWTYKTIPHQIFHINFFNSKICTIRQKVLNTTFIGPLWLFNFKCYTKIGKKVYIFPTSFYLCWWKVMRWCKSRLWSIIEIKIQRLPKPHQTQQFQL